VPSQPPQVKAAASFMDDDAAEQPSASATTTTAASFPVAHLFDDSPAGLQVSFCRHRFSLPVTKDTQGV
jgi:hypothetical protein